jgi:hypothetical protein
VGDRKQVTLSRPRTAGHSPAVLEYTAGQPGFKQGTAAGQWQHPPFEQNGRGYLPLQESLALLGYDADYDAGANLLTLTTK